MRNLTSRMQTAGYPVIMTEHTDHRTPPFSYILGLDAAGISWFLGDGTGFDDRNNGYLMVAAVLATRSALPGQRTDLL